MPEGAGSGEPGEHVPAPGDALTRLLRALGETRAVGGAADARTLADALWLAASGVLGEGTGPASRPPWEASEEPEPEEPERSGADALPGPAPGAAATTTSTALSVRHRPGSGTTVRGVPLSLGRADPLPDALAVGRAIQPFRRPWLRGGRSELDVEATVEHYARGGPLVPLFRPAPEPWFEVVVLVDASLSMGVWEETTRAVTRLLTALGGFRAVHTWRLEWQGTDPLVRDHHGREVPGDRVPHHGSGALGRRLVLVFSDCAARGWHTPAPWLLLRAWAHRVPVALVDPLPPRLWRRSALNLPAVRVTGSRVGAHNGTLRFPLPRRLGTEAGQASAGGRSTSARSTSARGASAGGASAGDGTAGGQGASAGPWTALPVVSCTPHLLGAWAATLMRSDPAGCGAVLIPATGRLPSRTREGETPPRRPDPARLAEAFAHTAPAPAVRLAVLCSGLPDLPLPLLHVLHKEVVPEASPADLAEVLTSGLFTVRREADSDPVLVFHPAARQYLRTHLTTHDEWRTRAAFGRHAAAHPNAPQGIAAVLHNPWAETELPAQEEPFAEVTAVARPTARDGGTRTVAAPDGASHVTRRAVGRLRSLLGTALSGRTLEEAEQLLRLLIGYAHSRLPAPAGMWPGTHTAFDDLRTAKGRIRAADVADELRRFLARHGIPLRSSAGWQDPAVQNLVMLAADGPMGIQVDTPFVFSWTALASAARSAGDRVAAYACPVEFLVSLDETDREDGFLDLDQCVRLAEWQGDRQGVTVHLRVQTRYGRPLSRSQAAFTGDLRALYVRAGSPSLAELVREAAAETPPLDLQVATLRSWLDGRSVPAEAPAFDWLARHLLARADLGHSPSGPTPPDDFAAPRLGHPLPSSRSRVQEMDRRALFDRAHHQLLRRVARDCATGTSHMVSLVGPDGSGKTLASLNATLELPDGWWTWRPDEDPDPAAVLDDPSGIAPRTVILLDPGERYLMDRSGSPSGEYFAAALRRRLSETGTGPVLVLATLLPETWSLLTSAPGPDGTVPHPAARALCEEGVVVHCEATVDHRSASAVGALVAAAVDARRCGHGPTMPAQLLADAARGYLADPASRPSPEGISADVLMGMGLRRLPRAENDAGAPESVPTYYRLSEDMERRAADSSPHAPPPDTLWEALATHASGPDLDRIARTAQRLGHTQQAERFRALTRREQQARALGSRLQTHHTRADARDTVEDALEWLQVNDRAESAQYVLNGMLSRVGLPRQVTAKAVRQALDWLTVHEEAPGARLVLDPLLRIVPLPQQQALQAVDHALVWLRHHEDLESAQFVLRSVLSRDDLARAQTAAAMEATLGWLERHNSGGSDAFVLSAALRRTDLAPEPRTRILALGITWLRKAPNPTHARFVLLPLLQRVDLTPEESLLATALALDWLRAHGTAHDTQFVLSFLLSHRGLRPEEVRETGQLALDWLRTHGADTSARDVLRPLLERDDLGPELRAEAVAAGEEWSRTRPPEEPADPALTRLFGGHHADAVSARDHVVLAAEIVGHAEAAPMPQVDRTSLLNDILSRALERREGLIPDSQFTKGAETVVYFSHQLQRTPLVPDLLTDLYDHALSGNLRLRVVLHCSTVVGDKLGWRGEAVMFARRLADSSVVRTALRGAPRSPLVAVVSDKLFTSAYFGPEHPLADHFRAVSVHTKERVEKAWVSIGGFEQPPGPNR
ncbi:SAV_2336 N-terminal domain-related protein [Streptomyces bacillaris]|uniref:SAV_2336 N-terminal domain-related protein n=1 Tax=Streptomyces bacillaris TaxID=68179 RepID=UPI0035E1A446